jgi:hypothetical protein
MKTNHNQSNPKTKQIKTIKQNTSKQIKTNQTNQNTKQFKVHQIKNQNKNQTKQHKTKQFK